MNLVCVCVCLSRCSWTWWRTTRPVCGFWSWQRMTSVRSCSSRSVTCCPKGRTMTTEMPRPSIQDPPPAVPCCQSETSTSPPPGSPTAVRAEHTPPPPPTSSPFCPALPELKVSWVQTAQNQSRNLSYWFYWCSLSCWFHWLLLLRF